MAIVILGATPALLASPPSAQRAATQVARAVAPPFADVQVDRAKPENGALVAHRQDGTNAVLTKPI